MKSLKTDPKPAKIVFYHNNFRKGKTFDLAQAQKKHRQMIDDGWVDTPAKLDPIDPIDPIEHIESKEPLINRFIQSPSGLSKDELIALGKDYSLKLTRKMKEGTMVGRICQAIEDSKTEGD